MRTFKVLSALLCYPSEELIGALPELTGAVAAEALVPPRERQALLAFIDGLAGRDLVELQEDYVRLFDRGRALSLHLFEHVHGESRDRGQAMVDLLEHYRACGFELDARELPDHVPVFLEFLSRQPLVEAQLLLTDAMPMLALIGARLAEKQSDYCRLFDSLVALADMTAMAEEMRSRAAAEGPDETLVNMDKIWEEEAVTFMSGSNGCGQRTADPQAADAVRPVRWVDNPVAAKQ